MPSIDPTNTHMRYLFAQHPSLPTAAAIQGLLKTSAPPGIVTGHASDGSTVRFALVPHTAIEPITKAIYPEPPTFKPAQLAAKHLSNDSTSTMFRRHGNTATVPVQRPEPRELDMSTARLLIPQLHQEQHTLRCSVHGLSALWLESLGCA